jgi:WD40 repeat protein
VSNAPAPDCPYKGLEPYKEADLAYFFGRSEDATRIANALITAPLTVLYGKSGVGKSSVLQAAVPPLLRDPENALVLLWNAWQSPAFLDDLLAALFEEAGVEPSGTTLDQVLPRLASNLGRPVALIFDQFEEYFHYREGPRDACERQLARVANSGDDRIHLLLSMREDSLASLDRLRRRIPQILRNRLELKHLTQEGAQEAIDGPLRVFNDAHRTTITILPALRDRIIQEVSSRPPGEPRIETAYLQLALTKLWEASGGASAKALDARTFDRLGGAQDIARQHLEDVLDKLSPAERELAATLFDRLVTPGGGKVAHSVEALVGWAEADSKTVLALLEWLTRQESRLLRRVPSPDDPNVPGFELFHDVLGQPTRAWLERDSEARKRAKELEDQRKRIRTYGIAAAISLVFAVAAIGAAAYAIVQFQQVKKMQVEARLVDSSYRAVQARTQLKEGLPVTAMQLALAGLPESLAENTTRPWVGETAGALAEAMHEQRDMKLLRGDAKVKGITSVAFSPDGERIVAGGDDGTVRLWYLGDTPRAASFQNYTNWVRSVGLSPNGDRIWVSSVAFSPNGDRIVSGGKDGTVRLWKPDGSPAAAPFQAHDGEVFSVAFSPNGDRIVSGGKDGTMRLWKPDGTPAAAPFQAHDGEVFSVAFSPDGDRIVSGGKDGTVRLWKPDGTPAAPPFRGHDGAVLSVAFSPDGDRIVSGGLDDKLQLWEPAGSSAPEPFTANQGGEVWSVAYSRQGNRIISGGDGTVCLWDLDDSLAPESCKGPFKGHEDDVVSVAFSPQGDLIASGSDDGTVRLWRLGGGPAAEPFQNYANWVRSVALSARGDRVVSGGKDGKVRLWRLDGTLAAEPFEAHDREVVSVAFSPQGDLIASGSDDGTVRLWHLDGSRAVARFEGDVGLVWSIAFSPQGDRIVSGGKDGTVRLWRLDGTPAAEPFEGHTGAVLSVAFSPQGDRIVSGGRDGTMRLWHLDGTLAAEPFDADDREVVSVAFSPQGDLIASGSDDGTVRLWHLDGSRAGVPFRGHGDRVSSIAFSPQGDRIVSGSGDRTVRVWDTASGAELLVLRYNERAVIGVWFSTDGARIVSSSYDTVREMWIGRNRRELIETARSRLPRELTEEERRQFYLAAE